MPYATTAQLDNRLGEELYRIASDSDGNLEAARIEEALADASEEIDTYVGQAYRLPLPTVPPILERCACDMAAFLLARGLGTSEELTERYDRHVKWLKMVAARQVSLGLPIESEPEAAQSSFQSDARNDFKGWNP